MKTIYKLYLIWILLYVVYVIWVFKTDVTFITWIGSILLTVLGVGIPFISHEINHKD